jgi:hypothetical protein
MAEQRRVPSFCETWDLDGRAGSFTGYGLALRWQCLAPGPALDLDAFMIALLQVADRLALVRHHETMWEDYRVLRATIADALAGLRELEAERDASDLSPEEDEP